jgi:hypothetical protein
MPAHALSDSLLGLCIHPSLHPGRVLSCVATECRYLLCRCSAAALLQELAMAPAVPRSFSRHPPITARDSCNNVASGNARLHLLSLSIARPARRRMPAPAPAPVPVPYRLLLSVHL